MEVILLDKIAGLGSLGDKVSVRSGYARNYLLPQGKATAATAANIATFEARRAELEKASRDKKIAAEARAAQLDEGKLFGSVGTHDIASALTESGVPVAKSEVRLPNGNIRQLGEFDVVLHLHTEVEASVRVVVIAA